jgi:RNA polymerase sigma-70 factor, ECF subfamily
MALSTALTPDDQAGAAARGELDDASLASCRTLDPAALRKFVVTYQPMLFAYLSRSLGYGDHVEDLAQETLLRAIRALPTFEPQGAARPSTWLLTIARNLVVDHRKRRGETLRIAHDEDDSGPSDARTPETERHRTELGTALSVAAAELPDEQRDAFILAEFHDLTMDEMAVISGVPVGTVKARLSRARARLRELLGEFWEQEP